MSELWRLNASEIAARVGNRELSAVEVTEQSLQRQQDVNPAINAAAPISNWASMRGMCCISEYFSSSYFGM